MELIRAQPSSPLQHHDLTEQVEAAKQALDSVTTALEVKEVRDRSEALRVYAVAKRSREAADAAIEIRLYAERRAGQIRKEIPRELRIRIDWAQATDLVKQGMSIAEIAQELSCSETAVRRAAERDFRPDGRTKPPKEFDDELGISAATGTIWERLAEVPDDLFAAAIEEAKNDQRELTTRGILTRTQRLSARRIEPGIYALPSGRLLIKWRERGTQRSLTLATQQVSEARRHLLKARGLVRTSRSRESLELDAAYADVRRSLAALDHVIPALSKEAREASERAMTYLHKAEDEISVALRQIG